MDSKDFKKHEDKNEKQILKSADSGKRRLRAVMKKVMVALLICVLLFIGGYFAVSYYFKKSVDSPSGVVVMKGISGEVVIRRDSLGVPFVEAGGEPDLFFGAGYAAASDRLWQMTLMSMIMQGRLAEIVGENGLSMDLFMRTLGERRFVEKTMSELDSHSRMMLESYARGVNAYITAHKHLPAEFTFAGYKPHEWRPEDSLYVAGLMIMNLAGNLTEEINYLLLARKVGYEKAAWLVPVYPDEDLPFDEANKLAEIPSDKIISSPDGWPGLNKKIASVIRMGVPASNNWAVAGSKTKGGRTIIANDTHLALVIPDSWMMMHLRCPSYDAAGVMVPGLPFVALGFNGTMGWGVTMVMADTQDLFIEKFKITGGAHFYLYKGAWLPVEERKEVFNIKGGKSTSANIRSTVHGPLLNDALEKMPFPPVMDAQPMPLKSDYGLALSWAQEGGADTLAGFYRVAKARNVQEMRDGIALVRGMHLNFVYGDRNNIGFQVSGAFPVRKKGRGLLPSPGWTGELDWAGFLPFEKLPHKENPREGYLATANHRTVDKSYPYLLTASWFTPERYERLRDVLSSSVEVTADDMKKLQFDRRSQLAMKVQKMLSEGSLSLKIREVIASWTDADKRKRALDALDMLSPARFDCEMRPESAPAALLGAFEHCFVLEAFLDELGPENSPLWQGFLTISMVSYSAQEDHLTGREDSPFWDIAGRPERRTKAQVLAESLQKAVLMCQNRLGQKAEKWRWDGLLSYHWRHDISKAMRLLRPYLDRGPYPAGGDGHTVNVASFVWGKDFNVWLIPAMRLIVDFNSDEPAMLIVVPGQSGNPSSPHYDSMVPYFLEGRNHPLPFGRKAVEAQYRDVLVIKPK